MMRTLSIKLSLLLALTLVSGLSFGFDLERGEIDRVSVQDRVVVIDGQPMRMSNDAAKLKKMPSINELDKGMTVRYAEMPSLTDSLPELFRLRIERR